jgi:hypothetical protein
MGLGERPLPQGLCAHDRAERAACNVSKKTSAHVFEGLPASAKRRGRVGQYGRVSTCFVGLPALLLYRERKSVMCRFLGAGNDEALRMLSEKRQGKKSREVGHWIAREVLRR